MDEHVHKRFGDYEVLGELGRGGMGKVYRVRNVISDRVEAMKILLPNLAGQQELADRFLREIKLLASLNHPNIAALRTALTADNQLVMIMEYVEGITLAARLKYGPVSAADAMNYIDQVLRALSYAHEQHVVHRDIKPSNMMLTPQGVVKLMDFGIARSGDDPGLTVPGTAPGSLNYMSPEQVKGEPADARSDLYSVGISLYEMLTGQLPFQKDSDYAMMAAHLNETPRAPIELQTGLPPALNALVMKALEKDPALRFQSVEAFRDALSAVRQTIAPPGPSTTARLATMAVSPVAPEETVVTPSHPIPQPQPPPSVPPSPALESPMRNNRVLYMALGAIMLVVAMVGIGIYSRRAEADPGVPPPPHEEPATSSEPAPAIAVPDAVVDPPARNPIPAEAIPAPGPKAARRAPAKGAGNAVAQQTAPAPEPSAGLNQLDQLEHEVDQLTTRAGSVNSSLDRLQAQQARQGLSLRGDIASRQDSLRLNLSKAQDAVEHKDPTRAKRYKELTESDVEALEKFLGR